MLDVVLRADFNTKIVAGLLMIRTETTVLHLILLSLRGMRTELGLTEIYLNVLAL